MAYRRRGDYSDFAPENLTTSPILGFVGDQPPKVGGRAREHLATNVGKPRLRLGIGEDCIDLLVELSTISAGLFFGAPTPNHVVAS